MTPRSFFAPPFFYARRYHASSVSIQTERHAGTHRAPQSRARRDTQHTPGGMSPSVYMLRQGTRAPIGFGRIIAVHGRERIEAGAGVGAVLGRLAGVDRGRLGEVGVGSPVIDSHVIPCMIAGDFAWFCPLLHVPLHARRVSSGGAWRGEMEVRA